MYVTCRLIDRELQARQSRRGRHCNGKRTKLLRARRGRTGNCKRARRVAAAAAAARMAEPGAAGRSLFMLAEDWNDGCLVYGVRLEAAPPPSPGSGAPSALEINRGLAAVSGGAILALVSRSRRTVVHDTAARADTPGPRLRRSKRRPFMLPVGDGTVLVMDEVVRPGSCCFEALRRVPGGGWRADALPDPPVAYVDERSGLRDHPCISAYFAMGSRAWVSLWERGTFSLDTERGTWRTEGPWELPLKERGLFVPELGHVIGLARGLKLEHSLRSDRCCQVCALDVEARPPAVRRVWEIPPERVEEVPRSETVDLAYLGGGRFCVARSVVVEVPTVEGWSCEEKGTSFTLLDVRRLPGGDLELAVHGKAHSHVWPCGNIGHASFLQPA